MNGLKQKAAASKRLLACEAFKKRILRCRQARKTVLTHLKKGDLLLDKDQPTKAAPFLSNWSSDTHQGVPVIGLELNSSGIYSLPTEPMIYMGACECASCVYTHVFDAYHLVLWSRGELHQTHHASSKDLIKMLKLPLVAASEVSDEL
jgi:hypothetical protein